MKGKSTKFVICVRNDGAEDLEPRKVYQTLPDLAASREDFLRVVDESGDDYLYPAVYFAPVTLPGAIAKSLVSRAITPSRAVSVGRGRSPQARSRRVRG